MCHYCNLNKQTPPIRHTRARSFGQRTTRWNSMMHLLKEYSSGIQCLKALAISYILIETLPKILRRVSTDPVRKRVSTTLNLTSPPCTPPRPLSSFAFLHIACPSFIGWLVSICPNPKISYSNEVLCPWVTGTTIAWLGGGGNTSFLISL